VHRLDTICTVVNRPIAGYPGSMRGSVLWPSAHNLLELLVREEKARAAASSFDHLVRLRLQRKRKRYPERLRRLQIDGYLECRGLLDGKVGRISSLKDAGHVTGRAPIQSCDPGTERE
jgi:hypothetical protein